MMKKLLVLLSVMALGLGVSHAQVPDSVNISMNNISIPNSPGFILLDESPTVIDHPSSPKAFAAAIYNTYKQAGGFPSNYGVEFSPFWYFKHPRMNAFRFMGYDKANGKQLPFAQIKKASLSLAYVNTPDTANNNVSNIAFGVRTTLISIRSKDNIDALQQANLKVVESLRALNHKIIELDPLVPGYNEKVKAIIDNYENDKDLLAAEELLRQQINVRPIFALDAAFAYSTFFLNDKYADQHFGRLGIWAVLNYNQPLGKGPVPKNYISIYGVFRYLRDGTVMSSPGTYQKNNNLDFGAKAELELNKLSLAFEYVFRQESTLSQSTFRAVGMLNYRLTQSFALNASFGRNFGDEQNLVTLFGLSFGLNSGNERATVKE